MSGPVGIRSVTLDRRGCANHARSEPASAVSAPRAPTAMISASVSDPISPGPGAGLAGLTSPRRSPSPYSQVVRSSRAAKASASPTPPTVSLTCSDMTVSTSPQGNRESLVVRS